MAKAEPTHPGAQTRLRKVLPHVEVNTCAPRAQTVTESFLAVFY